MSFEVGWFGSCECSDREGGLAFVLFRATVNRSRGVCELFTALACEGKICALARSATRNGASVIPSRLRSFPWKDDGLGCCSNADA